VDIRTLPCEVSNPIPFEQDRVHAAYDPEAVHKFWRILVWVDQVFKEFRAAFRERIVRYIFSGGSFDLAVTRFSGRPAPERPGADAITREAYSHEVSSADSGLAEGTSRVLLSIPMRHRSRRVLRSSAFVQKRPFTIHR